MTLRLSGSFSQRPAELTKPIIVLHTTGKGDYVKPDFVKVRLFSTPDLAHEYVLENTYGGKHWSHAEVVTDGEKIELFYTGEE